MDEPIDSDEDSDVINFEDGSGYVEEVEEADVADANVYSGSSRGRTVDQNYELLTTSGLVSSMKSSTKTVANILLVSEAVARCLLIFYQWNVERLVDDYYAAHDFDAFFEAAGIDKPESLTCTDPIQDMETGPIMECEICLIPFTETSATDFVCGHQFCNICCSRYFEERIMNDGETNRIQCPHSSCRMLVDDETILNLISEKAKERWEILITRSFVLSNPSIRYCRSEDCEYAVKVSNVEPIKVICKCGFESCLECGEMWHDAITCTLLKKWIASLLEDPESYKWMKENAKQCPRCKVNIEKSGGCNHMSCGSCQFQFCWVCMRPWRGHFTFLCNQFTQADNFSDRLLHYSLRYNNHIRSVRLERGLYSSVESRMRNLEGAEGLTRNEVIFLQRAVDSLRRSRQMLISTYVFAFYVKRSNQQIIFEANQRDLEQATEDLSWFLEQEITNGSIGTIKKKVQEMSSYCDQRRITMLGHIREGYEKEYWELEVQLLGS